MTAVPRIRRLWAVIRTGAAGREVIEITAREPDTAGMSGVLLLTGMIAGDRLSLGLDLVSDPKADPDLTGPTGPNGWTPTFAGEADGTRTLLKVIDWTGGKGAKPALGYVGGTGATGLVAKAAAFNFNALKRVDIFTAQTAAVTGIAPIVFDPPFATLPAKALPTAIPNVLAGPIKAEIVAGSLTKTGCQVKVTQQALVGGLITALAGATVNVIVIEA
jgi:hypothetical protein